MILINNHYLVIYVFLLIKYHCKMGKNNKNESNEAKVQIVVIGNNKEKVDQFN